MKSIHPNKPKARREGLIVQTLPDETLVYDLDRDLAHCLNQTAALVWNRCDGTNTTRQIARAVSLDLERAIDEKFVWLALDQLDRNHLLISGPPAPLSSGMSRREVMRALAVSAAVAIPVVASIVAPVPAQAATGCKPNGSGCESGIECCSGFCNGSTCGSPA
jgi:Coenzyme PQQ synthesis protein D (PqqD)